MSSYLDMSLDDIIKMKRAESRAKKRNLRPWHFKPKRAPIMDARYKIISKNKIIRVTDARERIIQLRKQRDARIKLNQLRQEKATASRPFRNTFPRAPPATGSGFADSSRRVVLLPATTATPAFGLTNQLCNIPLNEARSIEKSRLFVVGSDLQITDDAPIEVKHIPLPSIKIKAQNTDGCANKLAANQRTVVPNNLSVAIPRSDETAQGVEEPRVEYRVVVTNLSPTVTNEDIQELFGEVGPMESKMVGTGIAEILYKTLNAARAAINLYHNKELDGMRMSCISARPPSPTVRPSAALSGCTEQAPAAGFAWFDLENIFISQPPATDSRVTQIFVGAVSVRCRIIGPTSWEEELEMI